MIIGAVSTTSSSSLSGTLLSFWRLSSRSFSSCAGAAPLELDDPVLASTFPMGLTLLLFPLSLVKAVAGQNPTADCSLLQAAAPTRPINNYRTIL